jgi:hypothetical protein
MVLVLAGGAVRRPVEVVPALNARLRRRHSIYNLGGAKAPVVYQINALLDAVIVFIPGSIHYVISLQKEK